MPRRRNEKSYEAEKQYHAGTNLAAIARSLRIPDSTVRRWKQIQQWDEKKSDTAKDMQTERINTKVNDKKPKTSPVKDAKTIDEQLAEKVEENDELTPQQKEFCIRYARACNATQAYAKVYNCSYTAARSSASRLLTLVNIKNEIKELRKIITAEYGDIGERDVIRMHMQIAFADITDYVEFESKDMPVVHKGEPVTTKHPETGDEFPMTRTVNLVKLCDSSMVDGQLLAEVSEGREGVKIKLTDRQKSLAFLERYFMINPMDRHRIEYDRKRYELEVKRTDADSKAITDIEDIATLAELLNDETSQDCLINE